MPEMVSLYLTPLDVLMFRGTRPFAQVPTGAESIFPFPRTVAGAVRTWLLKSIDPDGFSRLHGETTKDALQKAFNEDAKWVIESHLRGPVITHAGTAYFPAPRSLMRPRHESEESLLQLRPMQQVPPGYTPPPGAPDGFRPCWAEGTTRADPIADMYLDGTNLGRFCRGEPIRSDRVKERAAFWGLEPRLGIAVEGKTRAAQEHMLYTSSFMRLQEDHDIRIDIISNTPKIQRLVNNAIAKQPYLFLGGERKVARVRVEDPEWPPAPAWPPANGRFLTYLATPGRFSGGSWYPKSLAERFRLVSAVVGGPVAVPGWDVAHNMPLHSQYAVPAGAVYFWEVEDNDSLPEDLHGESIADDPDDRQAGWGICLRGEWDYA